MVQAEGSSPGGDAYQPFFSAMVFISVLSGLIDFSDIVKVGSHDPVFSSNYSSAHFFKTTIVCVNANF